MIKVQVAATKLKYYLYMFLPRASITSETNSVSFGFLCQHFLIHVLAWRNAMEKNQQRVEYLNWILLAMMERMTQGKESKEEQVIAVLSVFSHIHMRSAQAHTVGLSATIVEGDALLLKNMLQLCNNIFLYYSSRLSGACTTLRR